MLAWCSSTWKNCYGATEQFDNDEYDLRSSGEIKALVADTDKNPSQHSLQYWGHKAKTAGGVGCGVSVLAFAGAAAVASSTHSNASPPVNSPTSDHQSVGASLVLLTIAGVTGAVGVVLLVGGAAVEKVGQGWSAGAQYFSSNDTKKVGIANLSKYQSGGDVTVDIESSPRDEQDSSPNLRRRKISKEEI